MRWWPQPGDRTIFRVSRFAILVWALTGSAAAVADLPRPPSVFEQDMGPEPLVDANPPAPAAAAAAKPAAKAKPASQAQHAPAKTLAKASPAARPAPSAKASARVATAAPAAAALAAVAAPQAAAAPAAPATPPPTASAVASAAAGAAAAVQAAATAAPPAAPATAAVPAAPVVPAAAAVQAVASVKAEPAALDMPPATDPDFPELPILKPEIAFWTRVFSEYSEKQSVIHSMDDVRKVYTVLDFRGDAAVLSPFALDIKRARAEHDAVVKVDALLQRVDGLQATPQRMDAEERRIYDLYADSSDPHRFREAIGSFRVQRGLRERTGHALEISGRYLPQMEQIFASYGLPTRLTRLPLVESSFNLSAHSRDGAAGIWQFIPSAARIYMRLNEIADDRRDPWLSTDAAARHLKDDYGTLQDWPLAVTAYNYGRGGMYRALQAVNGHSLTDVLEHYDNERFGFASRNFYAEFCAAKDVERDWRQHFGDLTRDAPIRFETVTTQDYVPYSTLLRLSGTEPDAFQALNPSYNEAVTGGRLYVPPGALIRLPSGAAEQFKTQYAALGPDQRFGEQRQIYARHTVTKGETLAALARRFGVTPQALVAANQQLDGAAAVHAGQVVMIPPHESRTQLAAAVPHIVKTAATNAALAQPGESGGRVLLVRSGQTLSQIAHEYRTTVERLCALNGLGSPTLLKVGSKLKIPTD